MDKILPLAEIVPLLKPAFGTQKGCVVLAHGSFDLLHIGHVRHLRAAREYGDVLVVTVTGDAFINKGPGRPVFSEGMRAEMLAALEFVDYVSVVPGPDALPAIEAIRPNFYVKGQDYRNPEGDITGRIIAEREAVERHGGKLILTEEITYSSTELVNRHLDVFEPHVREHLDELRQRQVGQQIVELMDKIAEMRVLIVGEAIVDEYRYVQPMGKASKENIIATRLQDREIFMGGVIATANHAAALCKSVEVLTVVGDRDDYAQAMRAALKPNVAMRCVRRSGPTVHKCRYVDPTLLRKLFEVYEIDDAPLPTSQEVRLCDMFLDTGRCDLVIVNDFGHGMIGPDLIATIAGHSPILAINAQTNSANAGFNLISRYPRADFVCLDALEARLAVSGRTDELSQVIRALPGAIACERFMITNGRYGVLTYDVDGAVHTLPALSSKVVDTMGSGDAVLAIAAPLVAAGAPLDLVGFLGNVVGAQKVGIVGHRASIDRVAVLKAVSALLR